MTDSMEHLRVKLDLSDKKIKELHAEIMEKDDRIDELLMVVIDLLCREGDIAEIERQARELIDKNTKSL